MAHAVNAGACADVTRIRLIDMRTRSKVYTDGEIVSVVEFGVEVPEIPGKRYTVSAPYLWGIGWSIDHARCKPGLPTEFHPDTLAAIEAIDDDLVEMQENDEPKVLNTQQKALQGIV